MYVNHQNGRVNYSYSHSRNNSRSRFELQHFNTNEDQALINKKLPKELILRIFSFLDVVTLCRCAQVSKLWNVLALDGSNWQRVDLFAFQRDIEEIVVQNLSKRCGGFLKQLSLQGCKSIGDGALRIFSQNCRNIEELVLENCKRITDSTCISLSTYCTRLQRLDVSSCGQITDDSLVALSRGCSKLHHLNISWCSQVTNYGVQRLAQGCTHLLTFSAKGCILLTDDSLLHLTKSCTGLQTINLHSCDWIHWIARQDTLFRVKLDSVVATGNPYSNREECIAFQRPINMSATRTVYSNIKDVGIQYISQNCSDLRFLCISNCKQLTDASLQHLGLGCPELRTLEAAQCAEFTDAGFQALCRGCNNLQRMDLEECTRITDSTLVHLSLWCSGLQKLVKTLNLGDTFLTWSLSHCELITDEGIHQLGASPCSTDHLEYLELDNCPLITDNALDYLLQCRKLRRIELYDCQLITKAGIRKFQISLPNVKVQAYFAPITPTPSVEGGRTRMCRCCTVL